MINARELKTVEYSPPFNDGSTCVIETTSDPANQYQQKLVPSELQGILGGMLPKGFQINIYRPDARTKDLNYVSFENISSGCRVNLSVYYCFEDWAFRTNLIHFAEDLRSLIELRIANCQSTSVTKDEYGVTI
ncbi:hypothetical protein ACFL4K_02030 [Candidatus Neomarinimicrobiota bacterium]